jgi:ABC-type antimicrobial peptide transport system permease subunit
MCGFDFGQGHGELLERTFLLRHLWWQVGSWASSRSILYFIGVVLLDTLGDGTFCVGSASTLGGVLVHCSVVSTLVGGAFCGAISSKRAANFLIACIIFVPGCLHGVVGVGFCNARVISAATMAAASALEIPGTLQYWVKNSTVLEALILLRRSVN